MHRSRVFHRPAASPARRSPIILIRPVLRAQTRLHKWSIYLLPFCITLDPMIAAPPGERIRSRVPCRVIGSSCLPTVNPFVGIPQGSFTSPPLLAPRWGCRGNAPVQWLLFSRVIDEILPAAQQALNHAASFVPDGVPEIAVPGFTIAAGNRDIQYL